MSSPADADTGGHAPSPRIDLWIAGAALVAFLLTGIFVAAATTDPLMYVHAWIFVACTAGGLIWLIRRYADGIPADDFDAIVRPEKMIGPDPA